MTFTQRTVVHCMIITSPFANGSYVWKNVGVEGDRVTDSSSSGTYSYPGAFEQGELMIKPMPVQKGDGIHALPWAWSKYTLENQDVFVKSKSGGYHGSPDFNRTFSRDANINVAPKLVLSRDSPHTVSGLPSSVIELVKSTAILKARANLNKQVASVPLLFVERKAALSTAKSYAKFILNNAITMQRKDVKKWLTALKRQKRPEQMKTLAKQIANRHLEFVFGVLPLLGEIEDSIKHFSKPTVDVRTGRGRDRRNVEKESYSQVNGVIYNGAFGRFPVRGTVVTVSTVDFSTRCDLRCAITSQVLNNASLLGFNPLYTWYDMTPLSFIVGWFSNFNTWVQALDPLVGLEYVTGSSSHKETRTVQRYMDQLTASANRYNGEIQEYSVSPKKTASCRVEYDNFVREVHRTMPSLPSLRLVDRTSFFTHAASVSLAIQRLVRNAEKEIKVKAFKYRGPKPRNLPPIKYRKVKL